MILPHVGHFFCFFFFSSPNFNTQFNLHSIFTPFSQNHNNNPKQNYIKIPAKAQTGVFRQTTPKFAGLPETVKAYQQSLILEHEPQYRQQKSYINQAFYNLVLKNNSTYWTFIGVLAFTFSYTLDNAALSYVRNYNKGMMYEDVIATFPEIPPNCDE
jgi:hypothetical protein